MHRAGWASGNHLKSSLPNWRLKVKPGSVYELALESGAISTQCDSDCKAKHAGRVPVLGHRVVTLPSEFQD